MSEATAEGPSLQQLLDAAELKYDLQLDADGSAFAVFRHEVVGHGMVDVTAWLKGRQLRFVAAHVMQWDHSHEHLEWCFFVNMEWAYGDLHLDASGKWLDAAVSMYLGSGLPGRNHVRYVVTHLAESVRRLRDGELPCYAPQQGRRSTLDEVKQALVRCGLEPSTSPDGNTLGQKLNRGDVSVIVACYLFDEGTLLNVLCRFEPSWRVSDPAHVVPLLHSINRHLDYGTVNLDPDTQTIQYHLGIPVAWSMVDESLMKWAVSTALSTMIDRVLPGVPSFVRS